MAKRPFKDISKMNGKLIAKLNQTVAYNDEVYILGDFTLRGGEFANGILWALNGKKYIIRGNTINSVLTRLSTIQRLSG